MSGFCSSVDGEWTVMEKYGRAEGPAVNVMSRDCLLTLLVPCVFGERDATSACGEGTSHTRVS